MDFEYTESEQNQGRSEILPGRKSASKKRTRQEFSKILA